MRIYNPSLGRFLSIDPLFKNFAWNSTYSFAESDVIRSVDLDGAEKFVTNDGKYIGMIGGSTQVRSVNAKDINTVNFWIKAANNPPKNSDDQFVSRAIDRAKQFSSLKKWETFKRWDANLLGGNDGANVGNLSKKDWKVVSTGANVVGKTLKYAGYIAAFTPLIEFSPGLIEVGKGLETIGDAIDTGMEVHENGVMSGVKKVGLDYAVDKTMGTSNDLLKKTNVSKKVKDASAIYTEIKKDVVKDAIKEKTEDKK